jgi:hypothetical protein
MVFLSGILLDKKMLKYSKYGGKSTIWAHGIDIKHFLLTDATHKMYYFFGFINDFIGQTEISVWFSKAEILNVYSTLSTSS